MDKDNDNPIGNCLPEGISENQLQEAITSSGYPLQVDISDLLNPCFSVHPEWSYVDNDSGIMRSMDLLAERCLDETNDSDIRIRPKLDLLIECKKTNLPYVFFLSEFGLASHHFPLLVGLVSDVIAIHTNDFGGTFNLPPVDLLELRKHPNPYH